MVRSSFCSTNSCVEAEQVGETIVLFDSSDPELLRAVKRLVVNFECYDAFIAGVKAGEFDRDKL